jgi:hypothetical protein
MRLRSKLNNKDVAWSLAGSIVSIRTW